MKTNEEILKNISTKAPTFNELIKYIKEFEERKEI